MNAVLEAREPSARYLAAVEPPLLGQFDLIAQAPNGVARLRELILTLAVQGKLAPQDPSDEPASALLERIRAEKARLVKDGKIRKEKPLAEIAENEKPFVLPARWEWVRLGQIASRVQYGYTASADHSVLSPKLLRITDIQNDQVNWASVPGVQAGQQDLSGYFLESGDLLIARTGGTIGKTYLVTSAPVSSVFASYLIRVSPLSGVAPSYLKIFASSALYWSQLLASSMGTGQPNVNGTALSELVVPIPPIAEQSRIVARVQELMALCDVLEAKGELEVEQHARLVDSLFDSLANSESAHALAENWQRIATHFDLLIDRPAVVDALEQTILQLAVRGLLVPQDPTDEPASALLETIRAEKDRLIATGQLKRDKPLPPISDEEKPFELPEGWEWVTLDTLAQVGTGTTPSRDNPAYFTSGTIPWVTSGETGQTFISATAQHVTKLALGDTSLTLYPVGTLIVAMYGQGKTRGQISELLIEATTNQACAGIVLHEQHEDHRAYVKLVFEKSYDEIRELSAGGAQPNLNVGKVKATPISLPPLAEQSRIVARVTELRALCAQLRERLATTSQIQSRLAETLIEKAVA